MANAILPFSLDRGEEKLTDRGSLVMVNEYAQAIGLPEEVNEEFPSPGSNRRIEPSAYVRTLACHFLREGATLRWFARSRRIGAFTPWLTSARCPVPMGIRDMSRRNWRLASPHGERRSPGGASALHRHAGSPLLEDGGKWRG